MSSGTKKTSPARKAAGATATPRPRKKGQFKLRFHHQALPQEYLDHYEASQKLANAQSTTLSTKFPSVLDTPESPQDRTNENIRNWLQKISELQNEGVAMAPTSTEDCVHLPSATKMTVGPTPSPKMCSGNGDYSSGKTISTCPPTPSPSTSKVVNYNDLPFMGEMTLDNSKPRRGRKPKKADICHLIYKNYGTIFPGTPADLVDTSTSPVSSKAAAKKGEVQNKISSLLEKRLTVKGDSVKVLSPPPPVPAVQLPELVPKFEEPLNLCLRDTINDDVDSLTVSSDDDEDDVLDEELAKNLKLVLPNLHSSLLENTPKSLLTATPSSSGDAGGMFWPDASNNVYMHPMAALYYQKILEANAVTAAAAGMQSSPPPPLIQLTQRPLKSDSNGQTPSRPGTASSVSSFNSVNRPSPASNSNQPVQKRKRSAIFIPPMPLETTNPATEVSICKFKFTGGAKPSLQEKKMLSVDSGGNFRYYSGTGDKSMRGYEFFPRERLQQSALVAGSSAAGAFLNAHGEKMNVELAQPHMALTPTQELVPEISSTTMQTPKQSINHMSNRMFGMLPSCASSAALAGAPQLTQFLESSVSIQGPHQPSSQSSPLDRRKRKSRRSIQREKLEKTFKEKGFLIQTQQTESAGATYCKFRQLKKFTRYLFRSWKNYLPGDLQQQQRNQLQQENEPS